MLHPLFYAPSIFGALLDTEKGGFFSIAPQDTPEMDQKQYYLPETNILITLTRFTAEADPRILRTIERIQKELTHEPHVYRYRVDAAADDGLAGHEGTFSICSFWLVEALTRAGRLEEARQNLEQMLTYANHLGLYSEEVGPVGEALGNFPQAFTHLALISACHALDQALGEASSDRL